MPNLYWEEPDGMTDMRRAFQALPGVCKAFDWVISDWEISVTDPLFTADPMLIAGDVLEEFLNSHDVQFIWAVFSAVPHASKPDISQTPIANHDYWHGSHKPRLPEAVLEIVCVDSFSCLLIGLSEELAAKFLAAFPDTAGDMDEFNRLYIQ